MARILILSLFFAGFFLSVKGQTSPEITTPDIMKHITILASDSLEGRQPGTPGDAKAAEYIISQFQQAGLELLFDQGRQKFELITEVNAAKDCSMVLNGDNLTLDKDFTPALFSGNGTVDAQAAFCGYGFEINTEDLKWNDFQDIDINGKWALILKGDPEIDSAMSVFIPYSNDRTKIFNAVDKGAIGVIIVTPATVSPTDNLPKMHFDRSGASSPVPVIYITRKMANLLLAGNTTINELTQKLNDERAPHSFGIAKTIVSHITMEKKSSTTANIVAFLEGTDPELKDEYIVTGAHFDHLGYGGPGSGSRMPDTTAIHNGADDNASGVAAVLELAQYFSQSGAAHPRSMIFVTFSAEESGLVGSKYLSKHLPVAADKIVAMLNLDMIGRYNRTKGKISIGGTGTSLEADSIIDIVAQNRIFGIAKSPDGYGPSDHASFYSVGIPVFFISTGAHKDYHTPMDDVEFIDGEAAREITIFGADLISSIAALNEPLTFQRTASAAQGNRSGMRLKVTLGIMPDMVSQDNNGLGVDGVRPGGPADKGGILNGDRIVAINGNKVTNIYDYMHRLGKLKPGETAVVEVLRNGENEVLLIQL